MQKWDTCFFVEWNSLEAYRRRRLVFNVIFSVISIYKSNWQQKAKIPTSIAISLSLSLSLTHTHTHTHSLSLSFLQVWPENVHLVRPFWCLLCSTIYSLSKNVPPIITNSCWNERLNYRKNLLDIDILYLSKVVWN